VTIYVAAVETLSSGKRKDRMKLRLSSNLLEELVWVPVISLCKIFIPRFAFDARAMPYYAETGHSHPLIEGLYWITLINSKTLDKSIQGSVPTNIVLFLKFLK
jgi:hypothetical protein